MILDGQVLGKPLTEYSDTKSNIEALSGLREGMTAYATDTNELGTYDGASWAWGQGGSGGVSLDASTPQGVGASGVVGTSGSASHGNHVHQGVGGLYVAPNSAQYGNIALVASGNATVTQSSGSFTIGTSGSFTPLVHDMVTAHSYTGGDALDVFGLSAANTIARLTPSSAPGRASTLLKSDNNCSITLSSINLGATESQIVLQSAGVTGTLTWTPASSNKTITFPNLTGTLALGAGTCTPSTTNDITVTAHTHAITGFTSGSMANPSAVVGLTVVNGSASTGMRSDAAPALDQGIVPTWTGLHVFAQSNGTNSSVSYPITVQHSSTTSTPAAGWGAGIQFKLSDSGNTDVVSGAISSAWSAASAGLTNGDLILSSGSQGALVEALRISGHQVITGATSVSSVTTAPGIFVVCDNVAGGIGYITYGAGVPPAFVGYNARGTAASPSSTLSADVLMRITGRGYTTGSAFATSSRARMDFVASQDWGSGSATGTQIEFYTTPNNSGTSTLALTIGNNGSLGVGCSPSYKVDVAGLICANEYSDVSYTRYDGTVLTRNKALMKCENTTTYAGDVDTSNTTLYGMICHPDISTTNTTYTTSAIGLLFQPTISSSGSSARLSMVGVTSNVLRDSANDLSSYSSSAIVGANINVGHYTLCPSTAVTGTVTGVYPTIYNHGGTITTAYGLRAGISVGSASGAANPVITTYYALYLNTPAFANGGTITNEYGAYQTSPTAMNYFAGKFGIGVVPSASIFSIVGLPTSAAGLSTGDVWNNGGVLTIV